MVTDKAVTWQEALVACNAEGGSLASIHYVAENAALTTQTIMTDQPLWIGLRDYEVYFCG